CLHTWRQRRSPHHPLSLRHSTDQHNQNQFFHREDLLYAHSLGNFLFSCCSWFPMPKYSIHIQRGTKFNPVEEWRKSTGTYEAKIHRKPRKPLHTSGSGKPAMPAASEMPLPIIEAPAPRQAGRIRNDAAEGAHAASN